MACRPCPPAPNIVDCCTSLAGRAERSISPRLAVWGRRLPVMVAGSADMAHAAAVRKSASPFSAPNKATTRGGGHVMAHQLCGNGACADFAAAAPHERWARRTATRAGATQRQAREDAPKRDGPGGPPGTGQRVIGTRFRGGGAVTVTPRLHLVLLSQMHLPDMDGWRLLSASTPVFFFFFLVFFRTLMLLQTACRPASSHVSTQARLAAR